VGGGGGGRYVELVTKVYKLQSILSTNTSLAQSDAQWRTGEWQLSLYVKLYCFLSFLLVAVMVQYLN